MHSLCQLPWHSPCTVLPLARSVPALWGGASTRLGLGEPGVWAKLDEMKLVARKHIESCAKMFGPTKAHQRRGLRQVLWPAHGLGPRLDPPFPVPALTAHLTPCRRAPPRLE